MKKIISDLYSLFFYLLNRRREVHISRNIHFGKPCRITGDGYVSIGSNCKIGVRSIPSVTRSRNILNARKGAKIIIGDNCVIASAILIISEGFIEIGNDVIIGSNVKIYDSDFHNLSKTENYKRQGKVSIGSNVFIGDNVVITKGTTIGDNVIIGIGSVVTRDVPSYHLAYGNPVVIKPYTA
ncbi:acyltransferase [Serratia oryzae]|uniref:acyltransferase n=1 Tax=Serratia oryzae TaxID=2034155 RepID=UPI0012E1FBB3|nr:acyltransferase [Serratia oryzae]